MLEFIPTIPVVVNHSNDMRAVGKSCAEIDGLQISVNAKTGACFAPGPCSA
jgi:hypothetical protein